MTKSVLCHKVWTCESIERLNDNGCLEVIRLLSNAMGYSNLNQFAIKLLMNLNDNVINDTLTDIENLITEKLSNSSYYRQLQPKDKPKKHRKAPNHKAKNEAVEKDDVVHLKLVNHIMLSLANVEQARIIKKKQAHCELHAGEKKMVRQCS